MPVQFLRNECSFFLSFTTCWFFFVSTHYVLVFRVSKHVKTKSVSLAPSCVHRTLSLSTLTHFYYWPSNTCRGGKKCESLRSPEFLLPLGPEMGTLRFQSVGTNIVQFTILWSSAFILIQVVIAFTICLYTDVYFTIIQSKHLFLYSMYLDILPHIAYQHIYTFIVYTLIC